MEELPDTHRTRVALVATAVLGCLLCSGAQTPLFAQDRPDGVAAFREQLAPFTDRVRTVLGQGYETFRATLDALAAEEARQRALRGEVGFRFTGNEAGDYSGAAPGNDTLFRFGAAAALRRGTVPVALVLTADVDAQAGNNVFEQDVTRLHAAYAYRRGRHLEPFAWMERQTNSFMSIASRYETGAGVRIGADLWPVRDAADHAALAYVTREAAAGFACAVRQLEAAFDPRAPSTPGGCSPAPAAASLNGPGPTHAAFEGLRRALPDLTRSLRVSQSRLHLGIGLGVFSELENAAIVTGVSPLAPRRVSRPPHDRTVRLPGRHRYRLLVAPTFGIRPLQDVTLSFAPHFKLPISSPRIGHNGVMAYRLDLFFRLDWALGGQDGRDDNVRLVLKFDYFKNMGPPALTDDIIAAAAPEGVSYDRILATKKHRVVSLGVVIGLSP